MRCVSEEVWSKIIDRAGVDPSACEWSKPWLDEVVAAALSAAGGEAGPKGSAAPASFRNVPSVGLGLEAARELNDIGHTEVAATHRLEELIKELEHELREPQFAARREQLRERSSDRRGKAVSMEPWSELGLRDTLLLPPKRMTKTPGEREPRLRPVACYISDGMNDVAEADLCKVVGAISDDLADVVYGTEWRELHLVQTAVLIFEPKQVCGTGGSMPSKTRFLPPVLARINLDVVRDVYELGHKIQCKGKDGTRDVARYKGCVW